MANCAFGWPVYSDVGVTYTPVFSAGSWLAALPIANVQDRRPSKVARSTNALAASSTFRVDLGVARPVGILALVGTNLSAAATVQWKGGTSAGASDVYNPGALAVSFSAVSAEDRDGIDFPVVLVPAAAQTARHWECVITDTANTDGYIDIGRVIVAGKYQPTMNWSVGANLGLEDDTERVVTEGGAALYTEKSVRRVKRMVIENLAEAEAFANLWKMQRIAGVKRQVFFITDTADTTLMHERSFLAVMRQLNGLEYPYPLRNAVALELVEEL